MPNYERLRLLGEEIIIKACGNVDAVLLEEMTPPGGGPPMHRHSREDEILYLLAGRLRIWCGDETFDIGSGETMALPRGIAHGFRNIGPGYSRSLVAITPGGFENFFRQVAARALTIEHQDELHELASEYGLEILGPSPNS